MARKVALVGVGMQKFEFCKVETLEEMVFDVARNALEDARLSKDDIDAVVAGSAGG